MSIDDSFDIASFDVAQINSDFESDEEEQQQRQPHHRSAASRPQSQDVNVATSVSASAANLSSPKRSTSTTTAMTSYEQYQQQRSPASTSTFSASTSILWSTQADALLRAAVSVHGTQDWNVIGEQFNETRTPQQCERRWKEIGGGVEEGTITAATTTTTSQQQQRQQPLPSNRQSAAIKTSTATPVIPKLAFPSSSSTSVSTSSTSNPNPTSRPITASSSSALTQRARLAGLNLRLRAARRLQVWWRNVRACLKDKRERRRRLGKPEKQPRSTTSSGLGLAQLKKKLVAVSNSMSQHENNMNNNAGLRSSVASSAAAQQQQQQRPHTVHRAYPLTSRPASTAASSSSAATLFHKSVSPPPAPVVFRPFPSHAVPKLRALLSGFLVRHQLKQKATRELRRQIQDVRVMLVQVKEELRNAMEKGNRNEVRYATYFLQSLEQQLKGLINQMCEIFTTSSATPHIISPLHRHHYHSGTSRINFESTRSALNSAIGTPRLQHSNVPSVNSSVAVDNTSSATSGTAPATSRRPGASSTSAAAEMLKRKSQRRYLHRPVTASGLGGGGVNSVRSSIASAVPVSQHGGWVRDHATANENERDGGNQRISAASSNNASFISSSVNTSTSTSNSNPISSSHPLTSRQPGVAPSNSVNSSRAFLKRKSRPSPAVPTTKLDWSRVSSRVDDKLDGYVKPTHMQIYGSAASGNTNMNAAGGDKISQQPTVFDSATGGVWRGEDDEDDIDNQLLRDDDNDEVDDHYDDDNDDDPDRAQDESFSAAYARHQQRSDAAMNSSSQTYRDRPSTTNATSRSQQQQYNNGGASTARESSSAAMQRRAAFRPSGHAAAALPVVANSDSSAPVSTILSPRPLTSRAPPNTATTSTKPKKSRHILLAAGKMDLSKVRSRIDVTSPYKVEYSPPDSDRNDARSFEFGAESASPRPSTAGSMTNRQQQQQQQQRKSPMMVNEVKSPIVTAVTTQQQQQRVRPATSAPVLRKANSASASTSSSATTSTTTPAGAAPPVSSSLNLNPYRRSATPTRDELLRLDEELLRTKQEIEELRKSMEVGGSGGSGDNVDDHVDNSFSSVVSSRPSQAHHLQRPASSGSTHSRPSSASAASSHRIPSSSASPTKHRSRLSQQERLIHAEIEDIERSLREMSEVNELRKIEEEEKRRRKERQQQQQLEQQQQIQKVRAAAAAASIPTQKLMPINPFDEDLPSEWKRTVPPHESELPLFSSPGNPRPAATAASPPAVTGAARMGLTQKFDELAREVDSFMAIPKKA